MQLSFSLSTSGTSVSNLNFFSLVCNAKNKTYCFGCFNVIILILLDKNSTGNFEFSLSVSTFTLCSFGLNACTRQTEQINTAKTSFNKQLSSVTSFSSFQAFGFFRLYLAVYFFFFFFLFPGLFKQVLIKKAFAFVNRNVQSLL